MQVATPKKETIEEILEVCKLRYATGTVFAGLYDSSLHYSIQNNSEFFISQDKTYIYIADSIRVQDSVESKNISVYSNHKGYAKIIKEISLEDINNSLKIITKYTEDEL